ncbi:AMP-binding protein [Mycobacterium sp.]|uniref:AMP-binding protein n=1 Tax=Mycobacterium sp. TaxID=1785 RepID=UPI003BAED70A
MADAVTTATADPPVEINIGELFTAVAARHPDRPAIIRGDDVQTYRNLAERSARLARLLSDRGLGCFAERRDLAGHESGQHMLAQYLHNGQEYIEGLLGGFRARVAPFNVNYLYRADELLYLLEDAAPAVIQYHAAFAPQLAEVLPKLTTVPLLLQVSDDSANPLLAGALDYEAALAGSDLAIDTHPSPDDLYVIYTGGTTGMPKGVLWRQADAAVSTIGITSRRQAREWQSVTEIVDAVRSRPSRVLPCAPLMHGASQWAALGFLCEGNTVVFPERAESFRPADVLSAVEQHRVTAVTIVGDAFAYPLVEELDRHQHDVSSLRVVVSGGAALHATARNRLHELVPGLRIVENIGSSESGVQGSRGTTAVGHDGAFVPDRSTLVASEDMTSFLRSGDDATGWLARRGRIPLGYLGDPAKTARTFPVVDGVRVTIPGDRARLRADGEVELLGRDSLTINTGGEKVFVEEVESVLKDYPGIVDALVVGRPSARWGTEVAAVVAARPVLNTEELLQFCRRRLARYKVPKCVHVVDLIRRNPSGKGDYGWAAEQVLEPAIGPQPNEME